TWIGALLATAGLYLLSVTESFTIESGDGLELIGSFFWACHVLILGWLSPRMDVIKIAFFQYIVCSILSLITAGFIEIITLSGLIQAAVPILYGGICSVGIAYTLQVVAQKDAHPAHAAILLSLESVFAAIGGWIILAETLSLRAMAGCLLMLGGMLLSQLQGYIFPKSNPKAPPTALNSE
ncbi:MAG: DMT family transporter, partial [Desulfobacterales bacterium]|nr:DMT family transporter [Desulfobacterales bacterium]